MPEKARKQTAKKARKPRPARMKIDPLVTELDEATKAKLTESYRKTLSLLEAARSNNAAAKAQRTWGEPETMKVPMAMPIRAASGTKKSITWGRYPGGTSLFCNSAALSG